MAAICLTPEERERLAKLYPPEPERVPPAPRPRPQLVHPGPRPDLQGERHHNAVLTRELVTVLRLEVAAGSTCRDAARKRGLAWDTVVNAVSGRSWAWLKSPPPVIEARVHLTERIRKVMRSNVLVSWRVGNLTKWVGHESDVHVRVAVHRLMKQREVERTGRGLYRWGPPAPRPRASSTAAHCHPPFQKAWPAASASSTSPHSTACSSSCG